MGRAVMLAEIGAMAAEIVGSLPIMSSLLEAGGSALRYLVFKPLKWLENAIYEAAGLVLGINEVNPVYGIPYGTIWSRVLDMYLVSARHQLVTGYDAIRSFVHMVYGSAYEAVGRTVREVMELAVRARTALHGPIPFDLLWIGEIIEDIDPMVLAWLSILSGGHPILIAYDIAQSLPWLYEMHVREMYSDFDRLMRDYNEAKFAHIDVLRDEARWWVSEGVRVYHRAVNRMMYIVDHIIERTLARIWELLLALRVTYTWYLHGIVDIKRVVKAWDRLETELDEAYHLALKTMKIVEEYFEKMNFDKVIDNLLESVRHMNDILADWFMRQALNVTRYEGFKKAMRNLDEGLTTMLYAKYRFDVDKTIDVRYKFWRAEYEEPIGVLEVISLEAH